MRYYHSGDTGDLIYSLHYLANRPEMAYQTVHLYLGNLYRVREPFTKEKVENLTPVLEGQWYIDEVIHGYSPGSIELDRWRSMPGLNRNIDTGKTTILAATYEAYKEKVPTKIKPWMQCGHPKMVSEIVVNRSLRYRDNRTQFDISNAIFIGTPEEHADYERRMHKITYYPTPTFYDFFSVIAGCKTYVGNQSCGMAIAIALGVPEIFQEVYLPAANCLFPGIKKICDYSNCLTVLAKI